MEPRIKLFETVKRLHDAGTVKLSTSELDLISRETTDLIEKSLRNKRAEKMPEGFAEILGKLSDAEPEEAYSLVLNFLKDKGIVKDKEEKKDGDKPGEKPDFGKGKGPGPNKDEKGPKGMGMGGEPGESLEHEKKESPEEEMKEHKDMPFEKGAQSEVKMEDEADEDGPEGKGRLVEMQKKIDTVPATTSVEAMGLMEDKKSSQYKVKITAERNIVAYSEEKGPLFHAIPNRDVKRNPVALKRLANKVMGILMYQGPKAAAAKCGATLLAGVDDDVQLAADVTIDPNRDGVSDNAETDAQVGVDAPAGSTLENPENETKEDPDKINPTNREAMLSAYRASKGKKVADYEVVKKADTSIDKIETETKDGISEAPKSVTEDMDSDAREKPEGSDNDVTKDGEVDFQTVEASYQKLYASRAKKAAEEAVREATDKLLTCVRIASARMRLNQDAHPFKIAAADVLMSEDVEFTDGDKFVPMDAKTAAELIELISVEGHDGFVEHLLKRAFDLMEKDSSYLKDVEADLKTLVPISVEQERVSRVSKVSRLREKAVAGSLSENRESPLPLPEKKEKSAEVRNAFSGNKLGRRLSALKG